jgi:hypothetical protein
MTSLINPVKNQIMPTLKLSDGRTVTTHHAEFPGMAGETVTVLQYLDAAGNQVKPADVKSLVEPEIAACLNEWEASLAADNLAAAKAFIY